MVIAPFKEIKQAAIFRLTVDMRYRNASLEISHRIVEANELRESNAHLISAAQSDSMAIAGLRDREEALTIRGDRWARKAKRRGKALGIVLPLLVGTVMLHVVR